MGLPERRLLRRHSFQGWRFWITEFEIRNELLFGQDLLFCCF